MTTSSTFNFSPSNSELVLDAFEMCGISPEKLTQTHLFSARRSLNFVLSEVANDGPNLFAIDLQSVPLTQGQSVVTTPSSTIDVLDAYVTVFAGTASAADRGIGPLSRSQYAAFPNKLSQGSVTAYWVNRQNTPLIYLWQTPSDGTSVLNYYRMRRLQDASLGNAESPDINYRYLSAIGAKLAAKLAIKYAPDKVPLLKGEAKELWDLVKEEDRERVNLNFTPDISVYYPDGF